MSATDILVKSAKGEAELAGTAASISLKQRSLLVMINGMLSEADYLQRLKALGDVPGLIQELEAKGFIERKSGKPQPLKAIDHPMDSLKPDVRKYMAEYMYNAMGLGGESLALRLERCKSNKELAEMLVVCRETLSSIGKLTKAEEFANTVTIMLH